MSKGWRCRRCLSTNQPRTRKCAACGNKRPKKRVPAHRKAYLALTYEEYIERSGGEICAMCGNPPKEGGKKLHRDHDHRTGIPRALLCFRCNAAIRTYMDLDWAKRLVAYLSRFTNQNTEENDAQHERTVSGTRKSGTEKQPG